MTVKTRNRPEQRTAPKVYDLVNRKPLARFYYKGRSHSHPVRRTVMIIDETDTHITGYELREGSITRTPVEALKHVKTYRKDKIARYGDYSRLRMSSKGWLKLQAETTLERFPIVALFSEGA